MTGKIFAKAFALASLCLAMTAPFAHAADLDQWVGKSPMALIGGQTMFSAAGLTDPDLLNEDERGPGTSWGAAQKATVHFNVLGVQFPQYGYVFTECTTAKNCSSAASPDGIFFLAFNGPDYVIFYGGKKTGNKTTYCEYSGGWGCYDSSGSLPYGNPATMAQGVSERYQALRDAQPPAHIDLYSQCLEEHIEAYCQKYYN